MGLYETQEANYEYRKSMRESYNEGYEAGYKQGKKDATPKWIPFTLETAPKDAELYLIKVKTIIGSESIGIDRYSTTYSEWFIYDNNIVKKWMLIPKDEGEQNEKTN